MNIYRSIDEYQNPHGTVVALGYFDGVHEGHRAVIRACIDSRGDRRAVVLTFFESPAPALGRPVPPVLTNNTMKSELFAREGIDDVIFADFSALRELSAADFVTHILREKLSAQRVVCGYNYRFGKGGEGDTIALQKLCAAAGIAVTVIEPFYHEGEAVSSTRIRELMAEGRIDRANAMLGRRYSIAGMITGGNHIGSSLGYPTVNIPIADGAAVPRHGVYASVVTVDGVRIPGATNIGVHPTVGSNDTTLCETFLLDYSGGDLYTKAASCELIAFIRPEKHFDSIEALQAQIAADVARVKTLALSV
jgi:riboflavin kinase/FMN adenylyltransferase